MIARWLPHVDTADLVTHGLLRHLMSAWRDFTTRDVHQAASLAYYAVFSIFPLLLLTVSVASTAFEADTLRLQLLRLAQRFFPGETQTVIEPYITNVLTSGPVVDLVAAIGLAWSATSLFANLSRTFEAIFGAPPHARALWRHRLLGVGMIVGGAVILAAALFASFVFRLVGTSLFEHPGALMRVWSVLIPLILDLAILVLLFRFLPRAGIRWKALWPAAVIGSLGWELSKSLFVWYMENVANMDVVYGPLGAAVALLLWAYLSAAILLLSADVCAALNAWLIERERVQDAPNDSG
jgi:membrane protein